MSGNIQPGARVDQDVYERFKQAVTDKRGDRRGVVGEVLEELMRDYTEGSGSSTVEERLSRVESKLDAALTTEADGSGGSLDTFDGGQDTHTQTRPSAKAPRSEKRAWLVRLVRSKYDSQQVRRTDVREIVQSEYGFRDDTTDDYVEGVLEALEAAPHPSNPDLWLWGESLTEARQAAAQDVYDDALDETARLDDADAI